MFKVNSLHQTSLLQGLGGNGVIDACERSLKRLETGYIDLYLLHWPNDAVPVTETMDAMKSLVDQGKVRSVGLSNFDVDRIKEVISLSPIPVCNNQIEYHPYTHRDTIPQFCNEQDIKLTAYSPLARARVCNDPVLAQVGGKYGKTAAQTALKWLIQKGNIVIPKSSSEAHLRENIDIADFQLTEHDVAEIDNIKVRKRIVDTHYT